MGSVYGMIMAGGKGERFWPLSTERTPKQVLTTFGDKPLIATAAGYVRGLIDPEHLLVVTNKALVDPICGALPDVPGRNVIGEPVGRDTAAAIALGVGVVGVLDPDAVLCVLTADHIIREVDLFRKTLEGAIELAREEDVLVTIGIEPTEPSTGFGYIEVAEALPDRCGVSFFRARRFVEKPSEKVAKEYVASGRYRWNSGMFVWSVRTFRRALEALRPDLLDMADRLGAAFGTDAFDPLMAELYEPLEKISVDFAIMEKVENIAMASGAFHWDDVGSWTSLERHFSADADGNTIIGDCEAIDATGNIVVSDGRLTALIGVKDLVVVQAVGATLVCPRDRVQDVKAMVTRLREQGTRGDVL